MGPLDTCGACQTTQQNETLDRRGAADGPRDRVSDYLRQRFAANPWGNLWVQRRQCVVERPSPGTRATVRHRRGPRTETKSICTLPAVLGRIDRTYCFCFQTQLKFIIFLKMFLKLGN